MPHYLDHAAVFTPRSANRTADLPHPALGEESYNRRIVQRAMRHSSPETKRHYQLRMLEQVRQHLEKANEKVYGKGKVLRLYDGQLGAENEPEMTACKYRTEKE